MSEFGERPIYQLIEDVTLLEPVLIVGLEGWVDAGLGASTAVRELLES